MTEIETTMQAILDKAQGEALRGEYRTKPPSRQEIVAYCNAAINSGTGALADFYKDNPAQADIAVYGALYLWMATVERRIKTREAAE